MLKAEGHKIERTLGFSFITNWKNLTWKSAPPLRAPGCTSWVPLPPTTSLSPHQDQILPLCPSCFLGTVLSAQLHLALTPSALGRLPGPRPCSHHPLGCLQLTPARSSPEVIDLDQLTGLPNATISKFNSFSSSSAPPCNMPLSSSYILHLGTTTHPPTLGRNRAIILDILHLFNKP